MGRVRQRAGGLRDRCARQKGDRLHRGEYRERRAIFSVSRPHPPHDPSIPAPRNEGAFPDAQAPSMPAFNEQDVSDKPKRVRKSPLLTPDQIDEIDERYRARLRSMLSVDELVQNVIETLKRAGALENTYIVF